MEATKEVYKYSIPECCRYRTIEEHENILLCWGLVVAIENGVTMNCDGCTENINNYASPR